MGYGLILSLSSLENDCATPTNTFEPTQPSPTGVVDKLVEKNILDQGITGGIVLRRVR